MGDAAGANSDAFLGVSPRSVGGLAQHVYDLATALAQAGEEVHLITCAADKAKAQEVVNGIHVYRVNPYNLSAPDFPTWVLQFNLSMVEYGISLVNSLADSTWYTPMTGWWPMPAGH